MDFIIYSAALLITGVLVFTSIERPYWVASFLVFLFIYNLNVELPGPLDARGLLTVILFARLFIFDRQNYKLVKNLMLSDFNAVLLSIFLLLSFYTTYSWYGGLQNVIKTHAVLFVSLILGFIITINGQGRKVFFNALILAGIFYTIDMLYSTMIFGSLTTRSLLKTILLNNTSTMNHNGVGLICSLALIVMIYLYFIKKQIARTKSFILMFIFFMGLMISTSRSSLMALCLVLLILFLVQKEIKFNFNKVLITFFGLLVFFTSFYFVYNTLMSSGQFQSSFIDLTYYRLYEEPMSIFGGNEEKVFKESGNVREGNTRWRINRAVRDISAYSQLDLEIQLLGFGLDGYMLSGFGRDIYNAHNGYILILVERGLVGLLIFIFVLVNLSFKSFSLLRKGAINTPIIYIYLPIAIYAIGQNGELIGSLAFLYFGAMIANTKELLVSENMAEPETGLSHSTLPEKNLVYRK